MPRRVLRPIGFCSAAGGDPVSETSARLRAVGISGSPSATSKSRVLVEHALAQLEARGAATRLIDVATLPGDALLGRGSAAQVADALARVAEARIVVAGTPVYRATYSGLLKVFFDLLPQDGLVGKVGVPIVTGHGVAHSLAVDHGLRPLFASVGATVVANGVYATSEQFRDGKPEPGLCAAVERAVREAMALARAAID
ncbi:MAG: FMN reductase (NADPH) [Gemmatimonadetes bacterium]|nr:MAG: FMN reductase (NADPH) [Gemmatimonadota bacterium]